MFQKFKGFGMQDLELRFRNIKSLNWVALSLLVLFSKRLTAQNDTLPYKLFKDKIVWFADLGYSSAPFSIKNDFPGSLDKIKYRNNFRTVLGFGAAYRWFNLRLALSLPGSMRPESRYGKTEQFNLGFDFTIKKTFCDIDLRSYKGYSIKNAYNWNDSLNALHPNEIRSQLNAVSFSLNVWYFHNKDFRMEAIRGRTGMYKEQVHTWYLKNSLNIFGIGNGNGTIIPYQLTDSLDLKSNSNVISAFDIGVIPGYAYVNRIKNWQFSGSFGLGPVVQAKFYAAENQTRGFLGLAPRYDLRLIAGYNVERYFVMLLTDFDNKSISFNDLKYRQSYYSVRIAAGIRLERKEKKRVESE